MRIILMALTLTFSCTACLSTATEKGERTLMTNTAREMNHYVWLEVSEGASDACADIVIESELVYNLLAEAGSDMVKNVSLSRVESSLKKNGIREVGKFLSDRCFDRPINPRRLGFDNIDQMVSYYFAEGENEVWNLKGIIPSNKPYPNEPAMIASYIKAGYRVWIMDLAPILYLTKSAEEPNVDNKNPDY